MLNRSTGNQVRAVRGRARGKMRSENLSDSRQKNEVTEESIPMDIRERHHLPQSVIRISLSVTSFFCQKSLVRNSLPVFLPGAIVLWVVMAVVGCDAPQATLRTGPPFKPIDTWSRLKEDVSLPVYGSDQPVAAIHGYLGQRIQVPGVAGQARGCALVEVEGTEHFFIALGEIREWPADVAGKRVLVSGDLTGEWCSGHVVPQSELKDPRQNNIRAARRGFTFIMSKVLWHVAAEGRP